MIVPSAPMVAVLDAWRETGGKIDTLPATQARQARRLYESEQCDLDAADRLLIALGQPVHLAQLYPPPPRVGRAGYTWPNPHPLRRLSTEQVKAAHTLHIDGGLSLRELGRRLYERYGYASPKSCTMALSSAFRRHGLSRRDRIAATVAASTVHGRGSRANKAAYKRWHRETFGPWPSDRPALIPSPSTRTHG